METEKPSEIKLVTIRSAANFGFTIANNLSELLEKDDVLPSNWPKRFPITIKQIAQLPEVNGNSKVAKKVAEAARIIWKDMRIQAMEVEKDIMLHPEHYEMMEQHSPFDQESHMRDYAWRHISVDIEQIAGNVFVTEFGNEELAEKHVRTLLGAKKLKQNMLDFEDDFNAFINEIRELIRNKDGLKASVKLALICSINVNIQKANKLIEKEKTQKQ